MNIKLCKNGCNRIVDSNNTFLINELTRVGYKVVCDNAGKPIAVDMTKYGNKKQIENTEAAAAIAKLTEDKKPETPVAPVVTGK